MSDQFHRTRLLLGEEALQRLRAAHVVVVGCGAVGGFAVEAMARVGIGQLTLIDGDTVAESNINRQICATHSTVGQYKTEVLRCRIADICPDTVVETRTEFIGENNALSLIPEKADFIVDAIDDICGKVALIKAVQTRRIPIISSMGAAMKTDPRQIEVASLNQTRVCPLAARVRKMLKTEGADLSFPCVFSTEHPVGRQQTGRQMGSLVTITGIFGLTVANEVIKRIAADV